MTDSPLLAQSGIVTAIRKLPLNASCQARQFLQRGLRVATIGLEAFGKAGVTLVNAAMEVTQPCTYRSDAALILVVVT